MKGAPMKHVPRGKCANVLPYFWTNRFVAVAVTGGEKKAPPAKRRTNQLLEISAFMGSFTRE